MRPLRPRMAPRRRFYTTNSLLPRTLEKCAYAARRVARRSLLLESRLESVSCALITTMRSNSVALGRNSAGVTDVVRRVVTQPDTRLRSAGRLDAVARFPGHHTARGNPRRSRCGPSRPRVLARTRSGLLKCAGRIRQFSAVYSSGQRTRLDGCRVSGRSRFQ